MRDSRADRCVPHIVFFGEEVPLFPQAAEEMRDADVVIIVGTSMPGLSGGVADSLCAARCGLLSGRPEPQGVGAGVEVIAERAASGAETGGVSDRAGRRAVLIAAAGRPNRKSCSRRPDLF